MASSNNSPPTLAVLLCLVMVLWFNWAGWTIIYDDSNRSCKYKVEAKILETSPHPKFAHKCLMALQYDCPRAVCKRTITTEQEFPVSYCQEQYLGNRQKQPVLGKYMQGCVGVKDPDAFYLYSEGGDHDGTHSFVPPLWLYVDLAFAMLFTIVPWAFFAVLLLAWLSVRWPLHNLSFSCSSKSTRWPVEMASTSYAPVSPHRAAGKP